MPALNWNIFTGLPGGPEKNFEQLCRGIVRLTFGGYGSFRALANQPGVEFHLKLDKLCNALGHAGRWWGWQCKWYDPSANGALGSTRRREIEEGLRKTERHLPDLTDWVLWTHRTLAKNDQAWFHALTSTMKLHLWTADDVDNFLSGQAAVLRGTYFGELVLTPEILRDRHEQSVAPIRARWQPDVHQVREVERTVRRMLGEVDSWDVLGKLSTELRANAQMVESSPTVPTRLEPVVTAVVSASRQSANALDSVAEGIRSGNLDLLRDEIIARPRALPCDVATAPRTLRAANQRAGLYATNAVAGCWDAVRVLGEIEAGFASRLVAVLAPAGCGKTHLAAQLTAGTTARLHGVLLHGGELHATHTLDDLARTFCIGTQPVPTMEALLAAVDAAGQRAHHRIPVVIDGLNESEDPRRWKPLLAAVETTLAKYPYVLLVCTLRPEFADDAIPKGTLPLEITDYGEEIIEAVHEHFRYWKIDATDALLPGLLRHPLTLRLFCEVTNPTRQHFVGVDVMPGSLTALFERYLEQVVGRVVQRAPLARRLYPQDVNAAIAAIANRLWEKRARAIEFGELQTMLGEVQCPWDQSLVRALEHEGVLLRMPADGRDTFVPVYDLLGGHIIASALLAKFGASEFDTWVTEASTTIRFTDDYNVRHPLANDILRSLVEQVPRRFCAKQLWQLAEQPLRDRALRLAAMLEPARLDAATVDALLDLVRAGDPELLERCWHVRGAPHHPLNAEGLDRELREMTVADRDVRWTEWVRTNHDDVVGRGGSILRDLAKLDKRWRAGQMRPGDPLRARWVMWTLTSTVRRLRDQATRSLYWFGRVDPEGLFALTIESLSVNDAYVGERMLAASYGVVMSHQRADEEFAHVLGPFVKQLASALVGESAGAPTHHYLARLYVRGVVAFAARYYPSTLPETMRGAWAFATPTPVPPISKDEPEADEAERALYIDFENYTLGRLFDDRRNYDMDHAAHQAAVAYVRGVVWALGWRAARFDALDSRIAEDAHRHGRGDRPYVERYGKKYGQIGFFTYAGLLEAQGLLPGRTWRLSDVDLDPSFPDRPAVDGEPTVPAEWLSPSVVRHAQWVRESSTSVPRSLVVRERIGGHDGPWLAVHGFVKAEDKVLGREAWAFISALVTPKKTARQLVAALKSGLRPWVSRDVPSDYYVFAGEIPWHPSFAAEELAESGPSCAYRENVRVGTHNIPVEILAHRYAWESYHSEMNRAGGARVPSPNFSTRFDLRSVPQGFDQCLPDGRRATITLSGVDGLEGDVLYVREDLLRQYVGDRDVLWFAFGERELRPYPPSPPQWLVDAQREEEDAWREVLTAADLKQSTTPRAQRTRKRQPAPTSAAKELPAKRVSTQTGPTSGRPDGKKS